MNYLTFKPLGLIVFILLLIGCKAAPVYNVNQAEFNAPRSASLNKIEDAILKGARLAKWRAKSIGRGRIIAQYTAKKGKFSATVAINFDRKSYNISYLDSKNLKYLDRSNEALEDSDNAFSEFNPFKSDSDQTNAPAATIHKVYNKWVANLENKINASLSQLGKFATHQPKRIPAKQASFLCTDSPDTTLSGEARVSRPSVNLRGGASTKCAIVGNVSKNETIKLLGKKKSWYYISRSQGNPGWLYAPLVTRLSTQSKPKIKVAAASATPPPPLAPPRKKISIAVIEFKTLNKEAQKISLGDLISETFTSSLVNSSAFKIIERDQLDKVIKEMEMSQTGFIDTSDAVVIGKMLQADAIITGSVALLAGQIQLNARIIDIESAYVISAETRTTRYTLQKINSLVNEIVRNLSASLSNK